MVDALLLLGRGRYADPWHDYAACAQRVADELGRLSIAVRWRSTFPDLLDAEARPDLLVVLAGRHQGVADDSTAEWSGFHDRLAELVDGGTSLLALHSAFNTFTDSPHWSRLIGGRWIDGVSGHPPIGDATFTATRTHPVVQGIAAIQAYDEQYLRLEVAPTSEPLLVTREGDAEHPTAWVASGSCGRVVYDGLGHDVRSYESPQRVALLRRELAWLVAGTSAS